MFPAGLCCLQLCSDLRSIDESSRLGRTHLVAMVHPCWYRAEEEVEAEMLVTAETEEGKAAQAGVTVQPFPVTLFRRC